MDKHRCAELYNTLPTLHLSLEQQLHIERHLFLRYCDTLSEFNGRIVLTPHNPYANLDELKRAIRQGFFMVYSGGTQPIVSSIGNMMFRAAHDWLHYILDAEFDFAGEVKVFLHERELMRQPGADHELLYNFYWSEIIGQAAVVEITGMFPQQRIVVRL